MRPVDRAWAKGGHDFLLTVRSFWAGYLVCRALLVVAIPGTPVVVCLLQPRRLLVWESAFSCHWRPLSMTSTKTCLDAHF